MVWRHIVRLNEEERLKLFNENKNLAYTVAYRYNIGMEIEDTKQEALMALWVATERFDPDRSESFATYAYWIISSALQSNIVKNKSLISVPREVEQKTQGVHIDKVHETKLPTDHIDTVGIEVNRAIESLPPTMQAALQMKMNGANIREIGNKLRMSHMTAHNLIKRATELIAKWYEKGEE
jgi:RNA polymerase sigma factor (sigma-70 family)